MNAVEYVVVQAPAKVNLALSVGSLRPDGYHEVETVLHACDLVDRLVIRPSDSFGLSCEPDLGIPLEENIVHRAALLFAEHVGCEPLVSIEVFKCIPTGAGLGGGSSDAAGVIAGLSALWGLGESQDPFDVASRVGADVPFFLEGGTALLSGRGDVLVRRLDAPKLDIVIIKGVESISTAAAYTEYDRAPVASARPDALIAACESGDVREVARELYNNMEVAAANLVPQVADALAYLRSADGVLGSGVAGSGSAVFGICADQGVAERCALDAHLDGWWSAATRSYGTGVRVRRAKEAG